MPKKWTGDLVGLMHTYKITGRELGDKLGVSKQYVSMILNSHRSPVGVEQRFRAALNELITQKKVEEKEAQRRNQHDAEKNHS